MSSASSTNLQNVVVLS